MRLVLAAALVAALLSLAACGKPKPAPAAPPRDPRAGWYQLDSGRLVPAAGIASISPVRLKPWTVQSRITDAAFLGPDLYFTVNGSGISRMRIENGAPVFDNFFDSLIFPNRTLTNMVTRQTTITAHVYFNELLNTTAPAQLPIGGISLVSLDPSTGEYGFIMPPFQKKHPEWEAVGFLPVDGEEFYFEWKRAEKNETSFAYTRFDPVSGAETAVSREAYIASFKQSSLKALGGRAEREALFALCRSRLPELKEGVALHFTVRSAGDPIRRVFRYGEGSSGLEIVAVFEEPGCAYALLPNERVLRVPEAAAAETMTLPALPAGYRYTNIMRTGDYLFIPWEQASFTDVGAAGVLLYNIAPGP